MARKFISFLGTNPYDSGCYIHKDKSMGEYTSQFIQEVLVKTVCKDWNSSDKAIVFVTKESEELNWYNKSDKNRRLKVLLENTQLNTKPVLIPTGQNEEEIWQIFNIIINNIDEGDEIVLDITHALRYIPMLATVVLDYAKVVKNIKLLGIYYGAWDVRDKSTTIPKAPIFDLAPLIEMQEWSQAVNTFIKYGNSGHLEQISMTNLRPKLSKEIWARETRKFIDSVNNFTMNINTCRGQMILGKNANQKSIQFVTEDVKKNLENVKNLDENFQLKPLVPLISKIEESIETFDENSTLNTGLATVEWCIHNHLIQQAYTALEETLKTYICELEGLDANVPYNRETLVNNAIKRALPKARGEEIEADGYIPEDRKEEHKRMVQISDSLDLEFIRLADGVKARRNDINHFGFSKDAFTYKALEKDIENYYNKFLEIIDKKPINALNVKEESKRLFLIFSHKLTDIQIEDAKANLGIDEFIYLPDELQNIWRNISPYVEDINDKLEGFFKWIDVNVSKEDYILIQGDFGATYHLVKYCKSKDLRPIYSTTEREAVENRKGGSTIVLSHKVSHIRYREY